MATTGLNGFSLAKTFYIVLLGVVIACASLVLPKPKHAKGDQILLPVEVPVAEDVIVKNDALVPNPVVADKLYKDWTKEQELKKKRVNSGYCSCVIFSKAMTGYTQSVGAARNWPKNSSIPVVGGVVITNESRAGHVAVITAVYPDRIEVIEANYSRCRKSTRTILLSSPVILGFWQAKTNE